MIKKVFSANFENLDAFRETVAAAAIKWGFKDKDIYNLQLAVDEAATNIIEHTYENQADKTIELRITREGRAIVITLVDTGARFIPEDIQVPLQNPDLDSVALGGLGLYFIHKLMDEVEFSYQDGTGNILRMKKYLPIEAKPTNRSKQSINQIFDLGKKLIHSPTLENRKDLILATIASLVPGEAVAWLDESRLRLPDQVEDVFPSEPPSVLQKKAIKLKRLTRYHKDGTQAIALPIEDDGVVLGVIEVTRKDGERFHGREVNYLAGIAQTISIAFVAWHQLEIERFRLRQLVLVRNVSNQISNEPDIEELSKKVTRLIHSTFKYYYVGIFTYEGGEFLTFKGGMGGSTRSKGFVQEIPFNARFGSGLVGSAAAKGEMMYANNVLEDERYVHFDLLPETRSELALPLMIDEKVVGVLDLQSELEDAFHPNDLLVLQSLADTIAKAIEGSLLFGELKQQAQRINIISDVSRQITTILNLPELMQQVANLLSERFNFPYIHLFTVHPNRRQIVYEAGSGERSEALLGYVIDLDDPEGIISWVGRHGSTVLLKDVEADERYSTSPLPPFNTKSELTVPLVYNGAVNGILDVQSDKPNAFDADDQSLLETLADSIAAAIRNADLYRSEQWRRQSGESLREVAVLLSANATLDQVLDSILTELERNLPADYSSIWLLDENNIHCAAAHGADPSSLESIRDNDPNGFAVMGTALLASKPIVRKKEDPIGPSANYGGFNDNHSAIYVPMRIGDQPVGVLSMVHHTPGRYGHEALAMVTTFASYASVAIENARLYDSAQEQAYASATLLQVAQAVVSLTSLSEILTTITRILPILVGVDRVVIFQRDGDSLTPLEEYGIPNDHYDTFWRSYAPGEFQLLDVCLAEENMVLSSDAYLGFEKWSSAAVTSPQDFDSIINAEDRLLVALPLIMKGEVYGVLVIEEAIGGRRFRNRRFEILNGVAQQITLALQNETYQLEKSSRERLELEVKVAREIQETFLPKSVILPEGWSLASRWLTATQMGGDLYDVLPLGEGRVGYFIADVADKGIPAALFMALTRSLLHAAMQLFDSPARVLNWVNTKLYPDCEQGMFVTAFFGILDHPTGAFVYTNAGHNPPILFKAGRPILLTRTGIALGVLEDANYQEGNQSIGDGDLVCFYTDGITESFSRDEQAYGDGRLIKALKENLESPPLEILNAILHDLDDFTGGVALVDDISILILKKDL